MVRRFLSERMLRTRWQLTPLTVNGQPGFRCEQEIDGAWRAGAVNVISLRDGRVCAISGFVEPLLVGRFFSADR